MSEPISTRPSFAPRNWGGWLTVVLIWSMGQLPQGVGIALSRPLGWLALRLAGRRRQIAKRNIDRCFPELTPEKRERLLKDHDGALAVYRQILDPPRKLGGANEFAAVQGIARILTNRGKFDEALAAIDLAAVKDLKGFWRHSVLLSLGDTLAAAGRKSDAIKAYRSVLEDESAAAGHRREAKERIGQLKQK